MSWFRCLEGLRLGMFSNPLAQCRNDFIETPRSKQRLIQESRRLGPDFIINDLSQLAGEKLDIPLRHALVACERSPRWRLRNELLLILSNYDLKIFGHATLAAGPHGSIPSARNRSIKACRTNSDRVVCR